MIIRLHLSVASPLPHAMSTNENHIGWVGWFSVLGFLILGLLAVGESMAALDWPLTVGTTATLAILAGIGAIALWFGNDPTASPTARETRR